MDSKNVSALLNAFERLDPDMPIEVGPVSKTEFTYEFYLENASVTPVSEKMIQGYFGVPKVKVTQDSEGSRVLIQVSRVDMPSDGYHFSKVLKYIEANSEKGFFIGVGDFGPSFLDLNQIRHGLISGASGYGKSVFFKNLLSQSLAFHPDVINYIVDPKKVDFQGFSHHPNVPIVATDIEQWTSLLSALVIELSVREYYFSKAFQTPPDSLKEYLDFREKFGRKDLPEFKRMITWIDEAHALFSAEFSTQRELNRNLIDYLTRKGRSFGIHFMFSSQISRDLSSVGRMNCNIRMNFYHPEAWSSDDVNGEAPKKVPAVPGRLNYFDQVSGSQVQLQTPMAKGHELLAIAFGFGGKRTPIPNRGFTRISLQPGLLERWKLPQCLLNGKSIAQLTNRRIEIDLLPGTDSRFTEKFCFSEIYKLLPPIVSESDAEEDVLGASPESDLPDSSERSIVGEFQSILSQEKVDSLLHGVNLGSRARTSENKKDGHVALVIKDIAQSDNTLKFDEGVTLFRELKAQAEESFDWALRDLSQSDALLRVMRHTDSNAFVGELDISFSLLALESGTEKKLLDFMSALKICQSKRTFPPILILQGDEDLGKRTIVSAVAGKVRARIRMATREDLRSSPVYDRPKKSDPENAEKEPVVKKARSGRAPSSLEFVIFDSLEQAVKFGVQSPEGKIAVFMVENQRVRSTLLGTVIEKVELNLGNMQLPYCYVNLSPSTYQDPKVSEKLLKTLLMKYRCSGERGRKLGLREFTEAGLSPTPGVLDRFLARVSLFAKSQGKTLSSELIDHYLKENAPNRTVLSSEVRVLKPKKGLKDLVLSAETLNDLNDVIHRANHLNSPDWKFVEKLRGVGRMVALFSGPPGTGKTLAAEVVAFETGRDLWVADLSRIKDKFVGETEKRLTAMMRAAEVSQPVLLLDECDSFLRDKGSYGDNASGADSVNLLLTLVESFKGVLVMTTNYPEKLEAAMNRRFSVKAHFPLPDRIEQIRILKGLLEPDAPIKKGMDFEKLFEGISLTGGLIRNAVERAIIRMERNQSRSLTFEILREALVETYHESAQNVEVRKRIGIVA